MTQYSWLQSGQASTTQQSSSQQQQAGKVTRTGDFPLEPTDGVPLAPGNADGSGKNEKSWTSSERGATADPYLDMASLGLAPTGGAGGADGAGHAAGAQGGGHPVPTDEFLRLKEQTRLMLLSSAVAGGNEASPWAMPTGGAAAAAPANAAQLQPSAVLLEIDAIVRAATPAIATQQVPAHRYICTAAELFGWVPETSVVAVASKPAPVPGAEGLDEEVPVDDLPQLEAGDYDHLYALTEDAAVYAHPGPSVTVMTTASKMETVVALGEPAMIEAQSWQQVRLVRKPPVIGWLKAADSNKVSTDTLSTSLTGTPSLSLLNKSVGPAVRELEQLLSDQGYATGSIDETFDEATDKAVRKFQTDKKIYVDGDVGPQTVEKLKEGATAKPAEPTPTGTWVSGYQLRGAPIGHATTTSGAASSAGYSLAGALSMSGPCEVLQQNGTPAIYESDSGTMWYVRAEDGISGWMLAQNIEAAQRLIGPEEPNAHAATTSLTDELAAMCPNGITVAFVTQFTDRKGRAFDTFLHEGATFATNHQAVALSGGQIVTGTVNLITHKDQITGILATIQQALRGDAETLPAWARVAHMAFFTHGSWTRGPRIGGLQTDGDAWEQDGVLRSDDLEGFARTLTAYCTSDLEVSMFACSTGAEDQTGKNLSPEAIDSMGWGQQDTLKGGETSFADVMSDELVGAGAGDAQVMGHTTVGHTVQNPAARLFTGAEDGGVNVFNWVFLPLDSWLASELADVEASKVTSLPPSEYLEYKLFNFYQQLVNEDPALTTRMSSDPELFKVEVRERAIPWLHEELARLGVMSAEQIASRKAYFSPTSIPRKPVYAAWPPPENAVMIEPGTEIEIQGPAQQVGGQSCYPITWAGDPNGKDTDHFVQSYLPTSWVVEK